MVFGCLWAPAVAPPRLWDQDAGHSVLPCAHTPWDAPSWPWRGGFQASGQTGSKACPWVQPQLFLADRAPGLQHNLLAFCPGHLLSILALALQEGFGDGRV